jgi:4-hydroxybenzoate polyprenyltransferase
VQNDYYDVEVDRHSKYVANRPLSTGRISLRAVVLVFGVSFLLCVVIAGFFLFSVFSFIPLLVGFLCMTLYNKLSKRFAGMEYILGSGVLCFGLFGALTVSNSVSFLVVLVVFFGFFQWLFSVGVSANLKDVEFDTQQGIATTPVVFGVKVSKGSLVVPGLFMVYAFGIKIVHILIALCIVVLGYASFFVDGFPVPGFLFVVVSVVLLYLTYRLLSARLADRDTMLIFVASDCAYELFVCADFCVFDGFFIDYNDCVAGVLVSFFIW